jgi:hypothetical protein
LEVLLRGQRPILCLCQLPFVFDLLPLVFDVVKESKEVSSAAIRINTNAGYLVLLLDEAERRFLDVAI